MFSPKRVSRHARRFVCCGQAVSVRSDRTGLMEGAAWRGAAWPSAASRRRQPAAAVQLVAAGPHCTSTATPPQHDGVPVRPPLPSSALFPFAFFLSSAFAMRFANPFLLPFLTRCNLAQTRSQKDEPRNR